MSDLNRRTVGGFAWLSLGRGIRTGIQLIVLLALARMLTPAEFGVVSIALVVVGLAQLFVTLGVGPALVQRPVLRDEHVSTAAILSISLGTVFLATIWALSPAAGRFFEMEELDGVLRVLGLLFPIASLGVVSEAMLQREMQFRWLASREVVAYAIGYGLVGIAAAASGLGIWALVAASLTQEAVRVGMMLHARPVDRVRPSRLAFNELIFFGGGFTLGRVANYVAGQGDNLVVGKSLGAESLGIYGRAYQLMALPAVTLGSVVDQVLFPAMAKIQHDRKRLARVYSRGIRLMALSTIPVSAICIVLAPEIVKVLLGDQWDAAIVPFRILAVGMFFRTASKMGDSLARAMGAVYRRLWRQLAYALMVVVGALAGRTFGLEGVCVVVTGALVVNYCLGVDLSGRLTGTNWLELARDHVRGIVVGTAVGVEALAIAFVCRQLAVSPAFTLIACFVAIGISTVVSLATMRVAILGSDGDWLASAAHPWIDIFKKGIVRLRLRANLH